ncbi:MAG: (Fe-S)-binding protein [Dehalococcoidia bacterium]|nr:(Fe-S)-binding protein [Dehalococcoidia bacterium]
MLPSREIFWNIPLNFVLYIMMLVPLGLLVWAVYKRYQLWHKGKPESRQGNVWRRVKAFIGPAVIDGLLHRRILGNRYGGIMHILILWGSLPLLVAAAVDAFSHYVYDFMVGPTYLIFSLIVDLGGLAVIAGVLMAVFRRYVLRPKKLDILWDDGVVLGSILLIVVTGYVIEGLRMAATELPVNPDWSRYSPGGLVVANALQGFVASNTGAAEGLHRGLWWFHATLTFGFMSYVFLRFSKIAHLVFSPLNAFYRSLKPKGALTPIDIEKVETLGVGNIEEFTWKQLLDLDACTRCGRCQEACPAFFSGKPLNPKKVILDLKRAMVEKWVTKKGDTIGQILPGGVIGTEELWNCTTCRACMEQCPVFIEHVDKIVELRRNLVLMQNSIPETGQRAIATMMKRGDPMSGTIYLRTDWYKDLGVKVLSQDANVDIMLFVGCVGAMDDRAQKATISLAKVLKAAGVNFGVLGAEETCCGDPARRLGHELQFQAQALRNIETMQRYNVKKVLASCPHCYNTLKVEYPQFGGNFQVIHHTEFLADLLRSGKLKPSKRLDATVVYHDPCYLGRYNDNYQAPRELLAAIPGLKLVEMDRSGKKSFCCGGGGGHLWLEETSGQRINVIRTEQALDTKASTVGIACPYCLQMFEDGISRKQLGDKLKAREVSELLEQSL